MLLRSAIMENKKSRSEEQLNYRKEMKSHKHPDYIVAQKKRPGGREDLEFILNFFQNSIFYSFHILFHEIKIRIPVFYRQHYFLPFDSLRPHFITICIFFFLFLYGTSYKLINKSITFKICDF